MNTTQAETFISPVRVMRIRESKEREMDVFRSNARQFLKACNYDKMPLEKVMMVTFRQVEAQWKEKVGRKLAPRERQ